MARARRLAVLVAVASTVALSIPTSATPVTPAVPPPTCSPAPADCTLWHTTNVTATWPTAPPGVTPLGCESETITTDTDGFLVSCSWWTQEGGTTSREVPVRRDATAPAVTASPSRAPDSNGWYNHGLGIDFSGSDGTSGLAGCTGDQNYSAPDSASVTINGSCTDVAGNTRNASFTFKYDATDPSASGSASRGPDHNGWYNHGLSVAFSGTDALSGPVACTGGRNYTGPDSASVTLNGSCTDQAGNPSGASVSFKYDATAPDVEARPSRAPDSNGWYNHGLSIDFVDADGPSPLAGCTGGRSYAGPDSASVTIDGSCTDVAGNTGSAPFTFRYDATAPSADARLIREPDSNGWYNHALTIDFSGSDGLSGPVACTADRDYTGPDSGAVTINGSCTDQAGNPSSASVSFKYDTTPPRVEARPDRKPNAKGWYNREVRVAFVGADATSGVETCTPAATYDGPDAKQAAVSGTCSDRAANVSGEALLQLKYDATDPELTRLRRAKVRGRGVLVRWSSDDASSFVVVRRPGREGARSSTVYTGPGHRLVDREVTAGVKYRYTVTASDEAGNSTAKDLVVRGESRAKRTRVESAAGPTLTHPAQGARVSAPPLLDWEAVPGATYYNVQLFRDGRKILSAWPAVTSLRLERSWRFRGRTQRLEPGRYRWYVWPGFRDRAASTYGKMLGSRTFVVTHG